LAAAFALAALAAVAVLTATANPPPEDVYASTDYGPGGYRAWAALLEREGIATSRFRLRPIELDARLDTLVSAQPPLARTNPSARTASDVAALAAWVRAGGRLVYLGRGVGLDAAERSSLQLPFFVPDVGARGPLVGPLAGGVRSVRGLGVNRFLLVDHAGVAALGDTNGDVVVRYPLGRGEIVAIVDPLPFSNAEIARADNARLAYLVARPRRADGVVAFDDGVHGALIDRPWYRALPVAVRVALGFGAVAVVLALLGSALPGVPPMRLRAAREPTSVEFVDALAALYARTNAREAVAAILIADARASAARQAGLPAETPAEVLATRLAGTSGGTALAELEGLAPAAVATDVDLLARAKLAHLVRKESIHGADRDRRGPAFTGGVRTHRRR
jgi:hypothetical protein